MKVCLYGAGRNKINKEYLEEGYLLGKRLSENGHSLVFGAGNRGMMGAVSKGFNDNNARILGISTVFMSEFQEVCEYCSEIIYAKSMDERKKLFVEHSDCFIISPGGIGTLDELFEILTLKNLERIDKPIIIFNINGFYDPLIFLLNDMVDEGFIKPSFNSLFEVCDNIEDIVNLLKKY